MKKNTSTFLLTFVASFLGAALFNYFKNGGTIRELIRGE